jgi:hypothetical protein
MRTANWARFLQARLTLCLKQISKQSFGLLQSFVCQDNGFGAPYRVGDQALLVQPLHRVPVERLPNALTVMPPQQKQRQHTVINSVGIDWHGTPGNCCRRSGYRHCSGAALKRFRMSYYESRLLTKRRYEGQEWSGNPAVRPASF